MSIRLRRKIAGSMDVLINPGETVTIMPGEYGALVIGAGATVFFETGHYAFTTLQSATFVAVERFEARREVFLAWSALEEAAGVPLLQWPDATTPAPAAEAAAPSDEEVK